MIYEDVYQECIKYYLESSLENGHRASWAEGFTTKYAYVAFKRFIYKKVRKEKWHNGAEPVKKPERLLELCNDDESAVKAYKDREDNLLELIK